MPRGGIGRASAALLAGAVVVGASWTGLRDSRSDAEQVTAAGSQTADEPTTTTTPAGPGQSSLPELSPEARACLEGEASRRSTDDSLADGVSDEQCDWLAEFGQAQADSLHDQLGAAATEAQYECLIAGFGALEPAEFAVLQRAGLAQGNDQPQANDILDGLFSGCGLAAPADD